MLVLTDYVAVSLLQAAESIRSHEILGSELFVKEERDDFVPVDLPWSVVDVPMALVSSPEVLEQLVDDFLEQAALPEIIITISQVPYWERRQMSHFMSELERIFNSIALVEETFGKSYKITWFAPEAHPAIEQIAHKYSNLVDLKPNVFVSKVSDPEWRGAHQESLELIDNTFLTHQLHTQPVDGELLELLKKLITFSNQAGGRDEL